MLWLAHALSLVRLPLAAVFWLVADDRAWALAVVAVSALTDLADGRVARWARRRDARGPDIGGWLDPLCDKAFAVAALVALVVRLDVPAWAVALVALRDLVMTPALLVYGLTSLRRRYPVPVRASWPGKLTTAAQFVVLVALVVEPVEARPLAAAPAVLGVWAVADYVVRAALSRR